MSIDPTWLDYANWKWGRPMLATDVFDEAEWEAFQAGWQSSNTAVDHLADIGRRVLYGLRVGDTRPGWFADRDTLSGLVAQGVPADPPAPPAGYTDAQIVAYNAGWTMRATEIQPIFSIGTDVLAGLSDGRATQADPTWLAERDELQSMLGVA